jgi:hypothetical protein
LFLCENWICFWKKYRLPVRFSRGRSTHFVPIISNQLIWRYTYISWKETSKLEAGASIRFFPCENWVSF